MIEQQKSSHSSTNKRAASKQAARSFSVGETACKVKESLAEDWLPRIYRERILEMRTRAHSLPAVSKGAAIEVQHTLLGVELKVGQRRVLCPDLATARYLAVFARVGCAAIAVPYDIRQTLLLADAVEFAWQRMLMSIDSFCKNEQLPRTTFHSRVRRILVDEIRQEVEQAGSGTPVPEFNQNTTQRLRRRVS